MPSRAIQPTEFSCSSAQMAELERKLNQTYCLAALKCTPNPAVTSLAASASTSYTFPHWPSGVLSRTPN